MSGPKNRLYCRAGNNPGEQSCHAFRVSTKNAITDDVFTKLVNFIAGELSRQKDSLNGRRKRDHRSGEADFRVGFYLGRDGRESLVPTILCFSNTFGEDETQLADLRSSLEAAWQKAQKILHPETAAG